MSATLELPVEQRDAFACFGSRCTVIAADARVADARAAVEQARARLLEWHAQFSRFQDASELTDESVFEGSRVVGITGGTSTPIEDLEAVAVRVLQLGGTEAVAGHAADLGHQAITSVSEAAYRSTSIGREANGLSKPPSRRVATTAARSIGRDSARSPINSDGCAMTSEAKPSARKSASMSPFTRL